MPRKQPANAADVIPNPDAAGLCITLLGRFAVWFGRCEVPTTAFSRRKALHLLKLIALQPGHQLHRDQALDLLWPHLAPRSATAQLFAGMPRFLTARAQRTPLILILDDLHAADAGTWKLFDYLSTYGSDDPTRATLPIVTALGALEAGHQPQLALLGEATYLMKDMIADEIHGVGLPPLKELLPKLFAAGVPIHV